MKILFSNYSFYTVPVQVNLCVCFTLLTSYPARMVGSAGTTCRGPVLDWWNGWGTEEFAGIPQRRAPSAPVRIREVPKYRIREIITERPVYRIRELLSERTPPHHHHQQHPLRHADPNGKRPWVPPPLPQHLLTQRDAQPPRSRPWKPPPMHMLVRHGQHSCSPAPAQAPPALAQAAARRAGDTP